MDFPVRIALLLALREGPGFALELIGRVKTRTKGEVGLNPGGSSITLQQLEQEGLVRSWRRPTGGAGRPRRYYELTSHGIAAAAGARAILDGLVGRPARSEVLPAEARNMAERVRRSGEWSAFALRIRGAVDRAEIR